MEGKNIVIALAGNPNSGKTTIFNNLTGAHQHVGNYPGVTVEKKEGWLKHEGFHITVIDLPGTYGLSAYSPDEFVARKVIIDEKPDLLVNIVDASNLERNLYLTTQLKELEVPMVLVLNMADIAERNGNMVNYELISQLLGMPVVRAVGTKNEGTADILDAVVSSVTGKDKPLPRMVRYRLEVEEEIDNLQKLFYSSDSTIPIEAAASSGYVGNGYPLRWSIIKLLENDRELTGKIKAHPQSQVLLEQLERSKHRIRSKSDDDLEMALVEDRYAFIRGVCREACQSRPIDRISITEKIDNVLLNRVLGIPLFLGMMWLLFQLTFTLGAPLMEWIETGVSILGGWVNGQMAEGLLRSLLADGIIGGVGGVIVFLPNIILLFLGIAFLESTGYMARAAFVMDEVMHKAGLHGKSFVPMLIGFGCTVPALMASRTLENPRDRLVTMLVTPLMSCGARLPVYTLLIGAFFTPQAAGNILFSLYLIGVILAIIMARVFRTWLLPGETEPFVMELPIYRLPTFKSVLITMWERAWLYLKKAGTIILALSIVMWALFTFPTVDKNGNEFESATEQVESSY
ncbi:MAG: ferrous iron transport protein B, partial [Clostridia bacterium]|nr:ferrous iron transport protein B [Clostridia bacterium]